MSTNFTEGPWTVSSLDPTIVGPVRLLAKDGAQVPQLLAVARLSFRGPETPYNGRLIAAAPQLLTTAESAWHLCQSLLSYRDGATDDLIRRVADALATALKKAKEGTDA